MTSRRRRRGHLTLISSRAPVRRRSGPAVAAEGQPRGALGLRLPRMVRGWTVVAVVAWWTPCLVAAQKGWHFQGHDGCPCVDPWRSWGATAGQTSVGTGLPCANATVTGTPTHAAAPVCLSKDYGSAGCGDWDQMLTPACVQANGADWDSGQPGWCATRWCYVDMKNCDMHNAATPEDRVTFSSTAGMDPNISLARSYSTCGNIDTYSTDKHYRTLNGAHLKVSFPGDSSSGCEPSPAHPCAAMPASCLRMHVPAPECCLTCMCLQTPFSRIRTAPRTAP